MFLQENKESSVIGRLFDILREPSFKLEYIFPFKLKDPRRHFVKFSFNFKRPFSLRNLNNFIS